MVHQLQDSAVQARALPHSGASVPETGLEDLEARIERLFARLRIAVVFGGDKSVDGAVINPTVNPRSWKSYENVANDIAAALRHIGFEHVTLLPDDMRIGERIRNDDIQFAWLNTGGVQGYNPLAHAPAMLEMLGIPYVGHDPLIMGVLDNKHAFKRDLNCFGIPTAPFMTWHMARGPFRPKINSRFIRTFKNHWDSYVVKPVSGRASLHVHVVDHENDLPDAIAEVFEATDNHVLIEAYLPGREFCVAVTGPVVSRNRRLFRTAEPFIFSPIERIFEPGERISTSMDIKPITTDRLRLLDREKNADEITRLQELARSVHLDFNLEALVRLDLRADSSGTLCVIEGNPKPDLKKPTQDSTSIVCLGLEEQEMDYDDLIFGQIAHRLDFLLNHRSQAAQRLVALAE